MSSGDDSGPSSNADADSDENKEGSGNDNAASPIDADYSSELTSDGRKTTSSSPTETDTNDDDYYDDYYDEDDDDDYDDSETSDERKPSPLQQNQEEKLGEEASDACNQTSSNLVNQNVRSFPYTLLLMLNDETEEGGKSIKWLPGGEGFEIVDQNALEKDILPKYFPSSCMFQSFVRRLYR